MPHEKFINPWGPGGKYWPPKWMEENVLTRDLQQENNCKVPLEQKALELLEEIKNEFKGQPFTDQVYNNLTNKVNAFLGATFQPNIKGTKCCGKITGYLINRTGEDGSESDLRTDRLKRLESLTEIAFPKIVISTASAGRNFFVQFGIIKVDIKECRKT